MPSPMATLTSLNFDKSIVDMRGDGWRVFALTPQLQKNSTDTEIGRNLCVGHWLSLGLESFQVGVISGHHSIQSCFVVKDANGAT